MWMMIEEQQSCMGLSLIALIHSSNCVMEFLIPFPQLLAGLLGFSLLYHLYHIIHSHNMKKNSSKIGAPEVPGAWPIVGHLHRFINDKKPLCQTLADMADKYGPAFMLQRGMKSTLVVSSWEVAKECFTTNDLAFASRPDTSAGRYMSYNNALFVLSPYGSHWRAMKNLARGELISPRTLEFVKHQRLSEIEAFIKELHGLSKDQSTTVVLSEMITHLAMNIMTKTINGRRVFHTFGATTEEGGKLRRVIHEFTDGVALKVVSDLIPFRFLVWLDPQGYIRLMKRIGKEFDSILQSWVDEHKIRRLVDGPRSDQDFIDFTMSAIEKGNVASEHASETNIKSTFQALLLGGSNTIPITLTWALSLLLNNEHVLKRAQEELDHKVGKDRWAEESDIKSLDYLQAIINETLRLYPAGPLGFPHVAREDCCVHGYHIPKDTHLLINMWKVHRDSSIWTKPDKFIPERFLTSQETYDAWKYHFQCIPFGLGRRSCPGMPLAWHVINLVLARLLQGFNLSRPMNIPVDMSERHGVLMFKALPLEVTITPRLHPKLYQEM